MSFDTFGKKILYIYIERERERERERVDVLTLCARTFNLPYLCNSLFIMKHPVSTIIKKEKKEKKSKLMFNNNEEFPLN